MIVNKDFTQRIARENERRRRPTVKLDGDTIRKLQELGRRLAEADEIHRSLVRAGKVGE